MNIVVLDGYTLNPGDNPWDEVESHGTLTVYDRTPKDDIVSRAAEADIVLTNKTLLTAETLNQLPNLKYVSVLATGFNVVDIEAAGERNIPVSNIPVYGTATVGQYVFALLLEICHHVGHHDNAVKEGKWSNNIEWCFWDFPLVELDELTMGIVGFGRIGRRTGELAHAFGMNVIASDVFKGEDPGYQPFAWEEIPDLFEKADVVSLHCPQTPENIEFVNKDLLSKMKPSAFLINTARGPLLNEQDVADALNEGVIAGAAVDVVSSEPISPENPLLKAKNILITPHMAWGTLSARKRIMATTAENIKSFLDGSPQNVIPKVRA